MIFLLCTQADAINTLTSFLVATINDILEKYPDLPLVPKARAEKHPFMLFAPCHMKYSHAGLIDAEAIDELGKNSDKNVSFVIKIRKKTWKIVQKGGQVEVVKFFVFFLYA